MGLLKHRIFNCRALASAILSLLVSHTASSQSSEPDRTPAMEDYGPSVLADSTQPEDKGVWHWEFVYLSDFSRNFTGGVKVGSAQMGLAAFRTNLDLEKGIGWKGASFFFHLQATHGKDLSAEAVGDAQVLSNIEAPANTGKVYELYLKQSFADEKYSVLFGLYDLNSEFYVTGSSGLFLNASFGIGKDISQTGTNGPSIFPTTSVAVRAHAKIFSDYYVQAVALDAVSGDPEQVHGTQIRYGSDEGILIVAEGGLDSESETELKKKLAIGIWQYSKKIDDLSDVDAGGEPIKKKNYGGYLLVEKAFRKNLTGFLRYGLASGDVNRFSSNLSAGVVTTGIFGRENDELGFAFTSVKNGKKYEEVTRSSGFETDSIETGIELTYKLAVTDQISIQPDLQYVIAPNTDPNLKDALAGFVRLRIGLED